MANDKDILQALADKADEENKERDAKINRQFQNKKKGKKKESKKESTEAPPPEDAVSKNTGEMEPIKESSIPLPEIKTKEPEESNPFGSLADEISKKSDALSPSSEKKQERNEPKDSKIKDVSSKELGEEVTKEHAEKIMSNKELGGRRRTVIVRTQVVEPDRSQDLGETSDPPKKETKPAPRLRLIREDTGEAYDIDRDLTIGRDDENDIVIPNPEGHYVSSHHAEIKLQGKDIFLKDIGSTNGTYVNDRKVGSWRLKAGNIVEFADIRFEVVEI